MLNLSSPSSGVKATWNKDAVNPVSLALLEQLLRESDSMILSADVKEARGSKKSGHSDLAPFEDI